MTRPRLLHLIATGAVLVCMVGRDAQAQGLSGRVAIEAIAAASAQPRSVDDPAVVLDLVGTVRLADGLDVIVRPWSRRNPGGDWMFEMYQLQVRYVSTTRVPFRIDAGIIPSPVGLFTLELQPHRNPLVGAPFYYFSRLPAVNGSRDRMRLMSGGYPLGAMFSTSGTRWDARAGVIDSSPSRPRNVFSEARPPAQPQLVLGGGVTPIVGMRLGVGFTHGRYRPRALSASGPAIGPLSATVMVVEGEYAFGYTRVSGEWVRNRFETPSGRAVARGFNIQAVRTLSPRIFAATRATRVWSPSVTAPVELLRTSTAFEATLGYRLSPELTVRGGYQRERGFKDARWSNDAVLSLVWAERWW